VTPPDESKFVALFSDFQEQSSEFTRRLQGVLDFTVDHDRSQSARFNLFVVRKVFSRWSAEILVILYSMKSTGFERLRKTLPGISSRILSAKLKTLEELGLVERKVLATRPPRVNYELTEKGITVAKLGEPVLLYLRYTEGLYSPKD
jgi:DNA-binding HxlR family transcriptional regulator